MACKNVDLRDLYFKRLRVGHRAMDREIRQTMEIIFQSDYVILSNLYPLPKNIIKLANPMNLI